MLTFILLVLPLLVLSLWVFGFVYVNDFSVGTKSLNDISKKYENVLIIFPHADDEALSSGGVISELSKSGVKLHWLLLTEGEKGNEYASTDEHLKKVRVEEAKRVAQIYGITILTQRDYPDNGIDQQKDLLTAELKQIIESTKPGLIITYDLAGLYGHPDHMAVSEVVTNLVKQNFPDTKLWYVSYPKKILDSASLPEYMAKDTSFKEKRSYPSFKVFVGYTGVVDKIKAVYMYESQRQSFLDSFQLSLFLFGSMFH